PPRAPLPRRRSPEDFWRGATRVTSGQVLHALVGSFSPGAHRSDRRESLRALGRSLEEWGSAAPADFEELVRLLLWNQASRRIGLLEGQLHEARGRPGFWADAVGRLLAALRAALADREYAVPSDLAGLTDGRDALGPFQRLVLRFGRLVQAWPDMVAAAKELRARGHGPAVA